jgi:hypothetical protein
MDMRHPCGLTIILSIPPGIPTSIVRSEKTRRHVVNSERVRSLIKVIYLVQFAAISIYLLEECVAMNYCGVVACWHFDIGNSVVVKAVGNGSVATHAAK